MSRSALFAASATLIGAAACSSPPTINPDAAGDATSTGGSGGGGNGGSGGQTDGGGDDRGAVPIYSAVFPPQATRLALASPDEVPAIRLPERHRR